MHYYYCYRRLEIKGISLIASRTSWNPQIYIARWLYHLYYRLNNGMTIFSRKLIVILEQGFHFLLVLRTLPLLSPIIIISADDMKQRAQSTIDALILTAALNNEFGITKARLARELVLTYRKVNKHCEELVQKRLLEYDPVTRTYRATPLGKEMVKLTEQLAVHYTPVNNILTKYKSRLEVDRIKTRNHARRILKEVYASSKARISLFAASPLLLIEHSLIHLDECITQALPC